jgi:hypothetical protein
MGFDFDQAYWRIVMLSGTSCHTPSGAIPTKVSRCTTRAV